jgi:hypothetical protein
VARAPRWPASRPRPGTGRYDPALMRRLATLLVLLACGLVAAGCGNKQETITQGETEGIYIDKYQVQISRYINANDIEDRDYLEGLPANTEQPTGEETWFGVFLRVQNETGAPRDPANEFEIVDTQENVYRPIPLDTDVNAFAYDAQPIPAHSVLPAPDSAAAHGVIQGSLLLFKVKTASLQNRPLEFRIKRGGVAETGVVDLDV